MPAKANIWSGYRFRVGLIGLVCLGFGGCSVWDGFVKYPRLTTIFIAYSTMPEETRDQNWPAYARQEGWPEDPDDVPRHIKTDWDIRTQYIMAAITLPIGLVFGFFLLRSYGRWVASDEDGLTTSWGHTVPFDQIARLDKKRWNKGIAVVHQTDGQQKLVLDDWKFEREAMDQIVEEVESHLSPDQVDQPAVAVADPSDHAGGAGEPGNDQRD